MRVINKNKERHIKDSIETEGGHLHGIPSTRRNTK